MSTFVLCVGCGTPLYGFSPCQWCTCESCGNDLRDGFCALCNSINLCVYDPNLNSFDCPPDSYHPPHPAYETYSCDSYRNDSHFGYDCQPQFPLNYESEPGYIENYNYYPYDSSSFPQQELCCEDCGVLPEADHCQPPQYNVNHPIFNAHNDLLNANNDLLNSQNKITIAQNKLMEQLTSMCAMVGQLIQKKQEEKQIAEEQATNARYWKILACCDDDDDYNSAITPNEPVDSLSMGDEHLKTVPFAGELTLLKSIPPGIDKTDCDHEKDIHLTKRLLYDNSSPHPPEEFVSENSNADIESFSPSPIHVEDSNSFMEEIDLSFNPDDPMPPSIEEDDVTLKGTF
nr:pre-mRNA splicing Prp18-interacting factor [Tanacetum cinerariifolium]